VAVSAADQALNQHFHFINPGRNTIRVFRFTLTIGLAAVSLLVLLWGACVVHANAKGGVVTICDDVHLATALSGGGMVTFNCGGPATLTLKTIAANTTIDGGGNITLPAPSSATRV
jgi:hypothetical protein